MQCGFGGTNLKQKFAVVTKGVTKTCAAQVLHCGCTHCYFSGVITMAQDAASWRATFTSKVVTEFASVCT